MCSVSCGPSLTARRAGRSGPLHAPHSSRLASLLAAACLFAAQPAFATWQYFGWADQFADLKFTRIFQDKAQRIWVTHERSTSVYDGVRWNHIAAGIQFGEPPSLGDLPDGAVRVGGSEYLFIGGSWQAKPLDIPGWPGGPIGPIWSTPSGGFWVGTTGSVMRLDGGGWSPYSLDEIGVGIVQFVIETAPDTIWFAGTVGASRFDGASFQRFGTAEGLPSSVVNDIGADDLGNVWILTASGLARFDGERFVPAGVSGNTLMVEHAGNVWVSGPGGTKRFNGFEWSPISALNYVDMYQDHEGNAWLCLEGGLYRFDGASISVVKDSYSIPNLGVQRLPNLLRDRLGNHWFASEDSGVARFDGTAWTSYRAPTLASDTVYAMLEDDQGGMWFASRRGLDRFDLGDARWDRYHPVDSIPDLGFDRLVKDSGGHVWALGSGYVCRFTDGARDSVLANLGGDPGCIVDDCGVIWCGSHPGGLSYLTPSGWLNIPTGSQFLPAGYLLHLVRGTEDGIWASTYDLDNHYDDRGGLTHLWFSNGCRDLQVKVFTNTSGLLSPWVTGIFPDRMGRVWVSQQSEVFPIGGLSRWDGDRWRYFTGQDQIQFSTNAADGVAGEIWCSLGDSLIRFQSDLVPPQTVFLTYPPEVSGTGAVSVAVIAAFGETGAEFSFRVDGMGWSDWSPVGSYRVEGLPDTLHVIEARSRDRDGNVDQTPAIARFRVDSTPPAPILSSPKSDSVLTGEIVVEGATADPRFRSARLLLRAIGSAETDTIPLNATVASTPIAGGRLAVWDTRNVDDGVYDLELVVTDALGLSGSTRVRVIVDNQDPPAGVTSPVQVIVATGGDIYSDRGDFHLYFAPRSFSQEVRVSVDRVVADSIPDPLPTGARRVGDGFRVDWNLAAVSRHPGRAERSLAGIQLPPGRPAFYRSTDGVQWTRLGGTESSQRIQIPIYEPGIYAVFTDTGEGTGNWSQLRFTPRVFSPAGTFADREVGISFSLPRPGPVTVRVFNRSGALVRELAQGHLAAGQNLIRWDGKDAHGRIVLDGVYIVTVQALGTTLKETLAVVR